MPEVYTLSAVRTRNAELVMVLEAARIPRDVVTGYALLVEGAVVLGLPLETFEALLGLSRLKPSSDPAAPGGPPDA